MITRYDRPDIEGITFEEPPDPWADAPAGGGTAAKTPTPSSRTFKIGALWYVVDPATGTPISPGYKTESEANYAATYTYPYQAPATATPGAQTAQASGGGSAATGSIPGGAEAGGVYNLTPTLGEGVPMNQSANATASGGPPTASDGDPVGPGGRTASQVRAASVAGQELLPGEREWYLSLPTTLRAQLEGGGAPAAAGGTGTGTASTTAGQPSAGIKGIVDSFTGFSDKDVINAYYTGEIDEPTLRAVLDYRNTDVNKTTGAVTRKYTDASLDRMIKQINADKPLGVQEKSIAQQFDPSLPHFGAVDTFNSSALGQVREEGLFTPNSGGSGAVPVTRTAPQGGGLDAAGMVVNSQLYTSDPNTYDQWGNLKYGGSIQSIAAQRGMPKGSTLSDLGLSLQEQQHTMDAFGSTPSQAMMANQIASGALNPANMRIDPSSGRPAGEVSEEELLRLQAQGAFRAKGGPVNAGVPYITGEERQEMYVSKNGLPRILGKRGAEVFTPPEDGTILPSVPQYGAWNGDAASVPFNVRRRNAFEDWQRFRDSDPSFAGRIGTLNPRLYAEDPRRYFMDKSLMDFGANQPPPRQDGGGTNPMVLRELAKGMNRRVKLAIPGVA